MSNTNNAAQQNGVNTVDNAIVGDDGNAAARCRLPPIGRAQPRIWFCQVEKMMQINQVHSDRSKYGLVVSALDVETLADVGDLLVNPPENDKYQALKAKILERLTDTPERQLQKVFSELQLDGRKPSQLFRHMRALADNLANDNVIRARWLALPPCHVQNILKIFRTETLDEVLAAADQLMESPIIPSINAIGCNGPHREAAQSEAGVSEIKVLLTQLIVLTRENLEWPSSRGST